MSASGLAERTEKKVLVGKRDAGPETCPGEGRPKAIAARTADPNRRDVCLMIDWKYSPEPENVKPLRRPPTPLTFGGPPLQWTSDPIGIPVDARPAGQEGE